MKVDGSLGSLLQGVSQQNPRDRLDGQCTLQENMTSDPVNGLSRRQPTDLVGYLGSASQILGWHNFQTRDGNKFLAMFEAGGVNVFDLNAEAQTVTPGAGALDYLSSGAVRCNTDGSDNTVVVNTEVVVNMDGSTTTTYFNTPTGCAIFQVLGGAFGATYTIYIDGGVAAYYTTCSGVNGLTDNQFVETSFITGQLIQGLVTAGTTHPGGEGATLGGTGLCAGWEIGSQGDVFYIKKPSGFFTASVGDGNGGVNFKCCTDSVTDVADLPRFSPHYYAVRVAQNSDPQKDMWFKFISYDRESSTTPAGAAFGNSGYWKEAVAPNTPTKLDASNTPHSLKYTGSGFEFNKEAYADRTIGTTVSNPDPSFVGNKIRDVSAFQGRTVFLSGSNVIMSRTNKPTSFWRGSASALADTDPIDINSTVDSSEMLAVVQFNKDLACFTPKAQFVVFGRSAITPNNAALVLTTKFESDPGAHPVSAGRTVFFSSVFGRYAGIREFFANATSDNNDSRPVTQHVNRYLVGKATGLTVSSNYETLLVHTDNQQTDVYLYQYIWNDEKKVQSAWSMWRFNKDIVHSFFEEDTLYLIQKIGTDYYLLRMPLDVQDSDGVGYPVYLDQRFDVFDCDDQFVLPFDYLAGDDQKMVCVQGTDCPTPGLVANIDSITNVPGTGYVVTLKRTMNGGNLIVGTRYTSRYKPTMPAVKDQSGVKIGTAKVRAKAFLITLDQTGEITGQVRSKYGDGPPVSFNARIVGDVDNVVGEQPLSDGQFTMPFRHNVDDAEIELYTDSHLPMGFADIEYVGQYSKRGRRIANTGGRE